MRVQQSFHTDLLRILILLIPFAGVLCPVIGGYAYSATFGTGEYIVFERGGNAYRMNVDGSGVGLIIKVAELPVCLPTGNGIVFVRYGSNPTGKDLFWTDPLDGSIRRLTRGLFITTLSVSKNAIVAFVSGTIGTQDLYTVRLSDTTVVQHTNGLAEVRIVQWSPDGRHLGFAASRDKGLDKKWEYSVLDYASGITKRIAESRYFYPSLSWSPDGSSVALLQGAGVELVDMKTGSHRPLPRPMGLLFDVRWSPDGQYLALIRNDEQCGKFSGSIYVIRLSDNSEKKVSNHGFTCRIYHSPRWSPDGTTLIFLAFRSRGDMNLDPFSKTIWDNIHIVNRDGTGQTNLSRNEDVKDTHPMWCKELTKN